MDDSVGFRFHPTEQEIISYFLKRKMGCPAWPSRTVREVKNICKFEPWVLPKHSPLPPDDQVWYFFNVPVSMSPNSNRIDRTTNIGFWKVTGKDRPIRDKQGKKEIGFKKNLVFYTGRVPNGVRTNWVMHEYHSNNVSSDKEEYVLFRLKRKSGDSSNTCDEPSRHLASDTGNHAENTASQVNLFDNNGLERSSLPELVSSIQLEQANRWDSNAFSKQMSSIQLEQGTSCLNGADDVNSLSALFSSIQSDKRRSSSGSSSIQSKQGTSYPNGLDRNSLPALFSSIQPDGSTTFSIGWESSPLSGLFSSMQSEQGTSYSNGADRNPLSALFSSIQSEQRCPYSNGADSFSLLSSIQSELRTSYSNGSDRDSLSALGKRSSYRSNDEWNLSDSHFITREQEDAFLYVGDSRDTDPEIFYAQGGQGMEIPISFNGNSSAEEYMGDNGNYQEVKLQFELQSDTEMFEMDYFDDFQMAEFPRSPRTCKAEHTPKSHRVVQEKCATRRVQSHGKVANKAVPNDEPREGATRVIGLSRTENNIEKFDEDQKMAQNNNGKTSSKFRSDESDGSNRKDSLFILQETPPSGRKTTPPIVYIGNMFVSFIVIIFFIWEMVSLIE